MKNLNKHRRKLDLFCKTSLILAIIFSALTIILTSQEVENYFMAHGNNHFFELYSNISYIIPNFNSSLITLTFLSFTYNLLITIISTTISKIHKDTYNIENTN